VDSIKEAASFNGVEVEGIDWFIPHQANLRMFQSISKTIKVPMERFYVTLHKYGNISSASCAIALDEAFATGASKRTTLSASLFSEEDSPGGAL